MAAGVGEEVSPDIIRHYRSLPGDVLRRTRGAGLSSQRVALINQILAERAGTARKLTVKQLVSKYAEPRYVDPEQEPQVTETERRIAEKHFGKGVKIRETRLVEGEPTQEQVVVSQQEPQTEQVRGRRVVGTYLVERGGAGRQLGRLWRIRKQERVERQLQALQEEEGAFQTEDDASVMLDEVGAIAASPPTPEFEDVGEVLTREQKRQKREELREERLELIKEREELPIGTRLSMAYRGVSTEAELIKIREQKVSPMVYIKTPPEELPDIPVGGFPGLIRGGVELTGIGLESVGITSEKVERIPGIGKVLTTPVSSDIPVRIGYGLFFLAPVSTTTAGYYKQLSPTRVSLKGVTAREGSISRTEALYEVQKGRTIQQKGAVQSISKVIGRTPSGKEIVKTYTTGTQIKAGVDFPTGRLFRYTTGDYGAASYSQVFTSGKLYATRGVGVHGPVTNVKDLIPTGTWQGYFGQGAGQIGKSGRWIGQLGATHTLGTKDIVTSAGLYKIAGTGGTFTLTDVSGTVNLGAATVTQTSQVSSTALSSLVSSAQATQQAVAATVSTTPTTSVNLLPAIFTGIRQPTTTITTTPTQITTPQEVIVPEQPEIPKPKLAPPITTTTTATRQRYGTGLVSAQPQKEITKQIQPLIQPQPTIQLQKPRQITLQTQRYTTLQKTPSISKQVYQLRFGSGFPQIPKPTPVPPGGGIFKLPKIKYKKTQEKGKYPVFGRRFGEFKPIGYGKTPQQAFGVGTKWAARTLGATFKVPSYKGKAPPGFYTKKKKEERFFIEMPKFRLSYPSEVKEIQYHRRKKRRK
jgi:hypothetical protein